METFPNHLKNKIAKNIAPLLNAQTLSSLRRARKWPNDNAMKREMAHRKKAITQLREVLAVYSHLEKIFSRVLGMQLYDPRHIPVTMIPARLMRITSITRPPHDLDLTALTAKAKLALANQNTTGPFVPFHVIPGQMPVFLTIDLVRRLAKASPSPHISIRKKEYRMTFVYMAADGSSSIVMDTTFTNSGHFGLVELDRVATVHGPTNKALRDDVVRELHKHKFRVPGPKTNRNKTPNRYVGLKGKAQLAKNFVRSAWTPPNHMSR